MTRRAFLGIDCGTGSTKALLLDADTTTPLAVGRADHEIIEAADGTSRQDPDWWVAAATAAVRGAIARAPDVEIAGIGVSGQQHGLVSLDAADRPLGTAPLWNDTTSALECERLTAALGGRARVLGLTGNSFLPGYTAPALLHFRRCEPATYADARRFCLPHDWLDLWLTGTYATEPGDASGTAWFDARDRVYQPEVLAAIDPDRDWVASLPPLVPSLSVIGQLRDGAARVLELPEGVAVSAGGGDNMCSAIGTGAITEGRVVVSLGTSATAFARRDAPAVDPQGEAAAFCSSDDGWLPLACTLNATGAMDWIRGLFGWDRPRFERAIRDAPPGADGLSFLPYLVGERTPEAPRAAGAFAGLRTGHGRDHFVRAVTEGVTFGVAYAIEALARAGVATKRVSVVGGGAASDAWCQLCADVLGVPVDRPAVTEAAATGAALQARWVIDGVRPPAELEVEARWEPQADERLAAAADRAAGLRRAAVSGVL